MKSRQVIMIRSLLHYEYVRPHEFMEKLNISLRTVRMEIHEINEMVKSRKVMIRSSSSKGYFIVREEHDEFNNFLNNMIKNLRNIEYPETLGERFLFTFVHLAFEKNPISIQNLANTMYVSKTVMIKTLNEIDEYMQNFVGVTLKRTKRGLYFQGEEKNIRHILSETLNYKTYGSILMHKTLKFQFGELYSKLYGYLQKELPIILYKNKLILIDKSVEGFLLDTFIMIYRNKLGFPLTFENNNEYPEIFNIIVEEVAKILIKEDIEISIDDKSFLKECLLTKRILYKNSILLEARKESIDLTEQFLLMVDKKYNTNYITNKELKDMLTVHIDKMLYRLEQGHFEHNSSVKNAEILYKNETKMVNILKKLILNKYGYEIPKEEIGFIIYYLGAFAKTKIKAIIISDVGQSIAESMAKQINNYCGDKIEIIGSYSLNYIRQFCIDADVIFTPIRLFNIDIPSTTKIVYINYVLQEEDIRRIQEFLINYNGGIDEN